MGCILNKPWLNVLKLPTIQSKFILPKYTNIIKDMVTPRDMTLQLDVKYFLKETQKNEVTMDYQNMFA